MREKKKRVHHSSNARVTTVQNHFPEDKSPAEEEFCPALDVAERAHFPAHRRLLGIYRSRFRRRPGTVWHQVTFEEFHKTTGLSLRTYRNAVDRLREEAETNGLKFRIVFKHDNGPKGSWVVLVSDAQQLEFDGEPLHYTEDGRDRHVRPQLRSGEVPKPPEAVAAGQRLSRPRSECSPYVRETSSADISKHASGGSESVDRGGGPSGPIGRQEKDPPPQWRQKPISSEGRRKLRAVAGYIAVDLEWIHWDNCRIDWKREPVAGWVYRQLRRGHSSRAISRAYERGLKSAHGWAVDKEARHGEFTLASTFAEASRRLDRDTRSVAQRATQFYAERRVARAEFEAALAANEPLPSHPPEEP